MSKQKHYLIYQITNLVNGKIYIGKHETYNLEDRYFGSGKHLKHAKEKYGLENFEFKILIDLKSREEMNLLEKMVVTEEFCKRKDTYNINVGGDGGWTYVNSTGKNAAGFAYLREHNLDNGQKNGQCLAKKLRSDPMFSKLFSESISRAMRKHKQEHPEYMVGENNPMFGRHQSSESRRKSSISHLGAKNPSFGKHWYHNQFTGERKLLYPEDVKDSTEW